MKNIFISNIIVHGYSDEKFQTNVNWEIDTEETENGIKALGPKISNVMLSGQKWDGRISVQRKSTVDGLSAFSLRLSYGTLFGKELILYFE